LIANGDFSAGSLAPWQLFGDVAGRIDSGAFAFYLPNPTSSGALLQPTGQVVSAGQILTAGLRIGNSGAVEKRITVVLHDRDFSDLFVCTFWLAPGQPLSPYTVRGFTTRAWANATLSIYPVTRGNDGSFLVDDVTWQSTPSNLIPGTECLEPTAQTVVDTAARGGAAPVRRALPAPPVVPRPRPDGGVAVGHRSSQTTAAQATVVEGLEWTPVSDGRPMVAWEQIIDLQRTGGAQLTVLSQMDGEEAAAEVQVSRDGHHWITVAAVRTGSGGPNWHSITVNLDAFAGDVIYIRFVIDHGPIASTPLAAWRVGDMRISRSRP
jgi:hypothetical protein